MMRSMYAGVSGLRNHQTKMDVIGNNIANINTVGFKKSRVEFKDTLYQQMRGASSTTEGSARGGTNPMNIGLGVTLASIDQILTPGATTTTNKTTDMAVDGNGYFILKNGDLEYYTRAGAFEFDNIGRLVNPSNGYKVQGWNATIDANGNISINPSGSTVDIDISQFKTRSMGAKTTTQAVLSGNLDSAIEFTPAQNEVQTLSFTTPTGGAAGGQFQLTFEGLQTKWINVASTPTATAANIQAELEALPNIVPGDVSVTWDAVKNNYNIEFKGNLANTDVSQLTFTAGPTVAFAGTDPKINVVGTTQDVTLSFSSIPNTGIVGSAFTLTYDQGGAMEEKTEPILIGRTVQETENNIKNALQATNFGRLYGVDSVTWDPPPASETFNIAFNTDPGRTLTAADVPAFTGGAATVVVEKEGARPFGTVPIDEVQRLKFPRDINNNEGGTPGGHFRLTLDGVDTDWIEVQPSTTDTAARIQAAMEALPAVGPSNIEVRWNETEKSYDIHFMNKQGQKAITLMSATTGITSEFGIMPDSLVVQTTPGSPAIAGPPPVPAVNEVQTLSLGGANQGGFTLTYNGDTTSFITTNATAADIQTALEDYIPALNGNVTVAGAVGGPFTITFNNALAATDVPLIRLSGATAYDGGPVTVTTTTPGDAGTAEVQSIKFAEPSGGTDGAYLRLSYNGNNTRWIQVAAATAGPPVQTATENTAARIQAALNENAGSFTPNAGVTVVYDNATESYVVTFAALGDQPAITVETGVEQKFNPSATGTVTSVAGTGTPTVNERQTLNLGGANSGNFALKYLGKSTGPISVYATATQIQEALEAIPELDNNITVTGAVGGPFTIEFINGLGLSNVESIVFQPLNPAGNADLISSTKGIEAQAPEDSFITSKEFYDTLGDPYTVYFRFFKYQVDAGTLPSASPVVQPVSKWGCDISLDPMFEKQKDYNSSTDFLARDIKGVAADVGSGEKLMRVYNIEFDGNGVLMNTNPTINYVINNQNPPPAGTNNTSIAIDLSKLSQYRSTDSAWVESQNGYASGDLMSISTNSDGSIIGAFSNNQSMELARVALASFQNPAGLTQIGGTMYQRSANSGDAKTGKPGDLGMGTIIPNSLEMSNVDLSEEFTDMIVTQRGFQANSRIITTSDEMLQELVNLKR